MGFDPVLPPRFPPRCGGGGSGRLAQGPTPSRCCTSRKVSCPSLGASNRGRRARRDCRPLSRQPLRRRQFGPVSPKLAGPHAARSLPFTIVWHRSPHLASFPCGDMSAVVGVVNLPDAAAYLNAPHPPSAAVRKPLAVLRQEVDVMQRPRHRRRGERLELFRAPMDLRHPGAVAQTPPNCPGVYRNAKSTPRFERGPYSPSFPDTLGGGHDAPGMRFEGGSVSKED